MKPESQVKFDLNYIELSKTQIVQQKTPLQTTSLTPPPARIGSRSNLNGCSPASPIIIGIIPVRARNPRDRSIKSSPIDMQIHRCYTAGVR